MVFKRAICTARQTVVKLVDNYEVGIRTEFVPIGHTHLKHVVVHRTLINLATGREMGMEARSLGMMTTASIRALAEQLLMEANRSA